MQCTLPWKKKKLHQCIILSANPGSGRDGSRLRGPIPDSTARPSCTSWWPQSFPRPCELHSQTQNLSPATPKKNSWQFWSSLLQSVRGITAADLMIPHKADFTLYTYVLCRPSPAPPPAFAFCPAHTTPGPAAAPCDCGGPTEGQKNTLQQCHASLTGARNSLKFAAKLSPPDLDFNIVSSLGLQHEPASTAWVLIFRQDRRLPQNHSCCGSPGIPVCSSTAPFFKKAKGLWPLLAACGVCPLHGAIPWPF